MSSVKSLVLKDLFSYKVTPVYYFFVAAIFCISAFIFFNLFGSFNAQVVEYLNLPVRDSRYAPNLNYSVVSSYFNALLFVILLFTPFITMKSFAGEKNSGMLSMLLLSKLSNFQIVLAKFISVLIFLLLILFLSSILPFSLIFFSDIEIGPVVTGFVGVLIASMSFSGIGILCSACSKNEFFAAITSLFALFFFYIIHAPAENMDGALGSVLKAVSPLWQVKDFLRGVVGFAPLVFFISLFLLTFSLTFVFFQKRNCDV